MASIRRAASAIRRSMPPLAANRVVAVIPFRCLILLASAVLVVEAQQAPHIAYVYPPGAQQGQTVVVNVAGQYLDGVNAVVLSGAGVQAKVLKLITPMANMKYSTLTFELNDLIDKKAAIAKEQKRQRSDVKLTSEDEKRMAELIDTLSNAVLNPTNPSMGSLVKVEITVAQDAAPGERDLRLLTSGGLSNPMVFCVGQLPELSKRASNVAGASWSDENPRSGIPAPIPASSHASSMEVTLAATVNGQMQPGGVDRIKFKANKGQHLVILAGTRELIPYIPDAVPGWFQATLTLYDSRGREVQYADHFRSSQEPVLHYVVPADDEYTLAIHDSLYRGREDFVYRISMGELPFITSIFPLGGKAGTRTQVELKGWNLPVARIIEEDKSRTTRGIYPISVRSGRQLSNLAPFSVDTLPEATEREPNNGIRDAQKIKIPVIINGRINQPGDCDVFRFDGREGEQIVAEVVARRLGSPVDSVLRLTDASGKQLAYNDDFEDKGAGLITHQADSRVLYKLPAKGTYFLHLGDLQHKGGVEYAYRLRVSHPQPDFELRVMPASVNVRAGSTVPITVHALRRDGFDGDIWLSLNGAPAGFVLNGPWIPGNQDEVRLTLTVPPNRQGQPIRLTLEGRAKVDGKDLRRPAIPAEYMTQAFDKHHLVPAKDWLIRVIGSASHRLPAN